MDQKMKERYCEYDVLRVVTTLLVLLGHCAYLIISSEYGGVDYEKYMGCDPPALHKILSSLVTVIYTFHMPLFTALSGALFCLYIRSINSMKDLLKKKFKRLIVPFLAVSLFYSIPIKYLSGYFQSPGTLVHDIFLGQLLLQGNSHLWFLEALFFDFILLYMLEKYLQGHYYLKLFMLFLLYEISFFMPISLIKYPFRYAVWFYMGYLFERKRRSVNEKLNRLIFAFSILLFCLSYMLRWYLPRYSFYFAKAGIEAINIALVLLGCFVTYCFSYFLSRTRLIQNKYYHVLLKDSYGIYLYSDPWNYMILWVGGILFPSFLFGTNLGTLVLFAVRLLFTGIVSIAITALLKKAKLRYLY